jgi:tetratricopeptide (TPR) repeat protein
MTKLALAAGAAAVALATAAAVGPLAPVASSQENDRQLGNVHFATSCNEVAQRRFDRAMRYQHSFWYSESKELFERVLAADPGCGIAYWGIALSLWNNPHNVPPAPNLAPALAAIEKGKAVGAKSERERDFIDALAVLYTDYDKIDYRVRLQSYLKAMEALAAKYPADDETQIFYAITLNVAASPADKTYANQLKGAAILEPIFRRQPQHPGVAHYLIHLYDYPAIADHGLDAARRYAAIAPAAPHAQHMPSHIFTRVGDWKDSISSNLASIKAVRTESEAPERLHARDYLVYAYLQLARDAEARAVVDQTLKAPPDKPDAFGAWFALAASPARYAIERADWKDAAGLAVPATKFAHVEAISRFARALGAARSGNPEAAQADVAKLAELRDKLRAAKNAYWANQVDIQHQVASAWVLNAQGKRDEAVKTMRAAADAEDKTEKAPVTPGPLVPARELLGAMLLEQGSAAEALAAFEATMRKEPHRFNATAGAAQAADKLGDKTKATAYYEQLVALAGGSDSDRPALAAAKRYLAKN